jgi:hypothetical protein
MKGVKRWMACGDNHGDMQDDRAVAACLEFSKTWKPEIRVHWGDGFDLRCFRKNASQEESRDSIKADVEKGLEFIGKYKPTVYLRGNHCERCGMRHRRMMGKSPTLPHT